MIPVLVIVVYAIGWFFTARFLYHHHVEKDVSDVMILGLVWPIIILCSVLERAIAAPTLRERRARKAVILATKRAEEEKAARQAAEEFDLSLLDLQCAPVWDNISGRETFQCQCGKGDVSH